MSVLASEKALTERGKSGVSSSWKRSGGEEEDERPQKKKKRKKVDAYDKRTLGYPSQ